MFRPQIIYLSRQLDGHEKTAKNTVSNWLGFYDPKRTMVEKQNSFFGFVRGSTISVTIHVLYSGLKGLGAASEIRGTFMSQGGRRSAMPHRVRFNENGFVGRVVMHCRGEHQHHASHMLNKWAICLFRNLSLKTHIEYLIQRSTQLSRTPHHTI